jgi:hypothetical protein
MDHQYVQPTVLMFDKLPKELICHIIVILNGGAISDDAMPERGFLYPGYRGGRELQYFKISRDAMTFWKHVCKYLCLTYSMNDQVCDMLFSNNTPQIEMWNDPHMDEYGSCFWDDHHSHERYIPRHLYAGNPKPWVMRLCSGPQTHEEALAIEAAEEAKVAAKWARKEKRCADAAIALVAGWGSVERRLCSRNK